jgi:hypothetical protein
MHSISSSLLAVPRGRFEPVPIHAYYSAVDEAIKQVSTEFYEWDNIEYSKEEDSRRDLYHIATGTVQFIGGIRVEVYERLLFDRETRWSPRGSQRLARLVEYSYSAILHKRGNVFRYDSPDLNITALTWEHHRFHHRHRFDVLGSGSEILPPDKVPPDQVPTLQQVLLETEQWYYDNLKAIRAGDGQ